MPTRSNAPKSINRERCIAARKVNLIFAKDIDAANAPYGHSGGGASCLAMPNYRRFHGAGGSYFFTHVTYQRYPWLCTDLGRQSLREAIVTIRKKYPFTIDAFVLLPDHLHCIWTLPEEDSDYGKRWRLIKLMVTKACGQKLALPSEKTLSGERRQEGNLWQRRYWEHCLRDQQDFINHCEYIHHNPVKHGLVACPTDWPYSSIHRYLT